jgi:predicted GIY-YIG superfamily endonuclease
MYAGVTTDLRPRIYEHKSKLRLVTKKERCFDSYLESGMEWFISFIMLMIVPHSGDPSLRSG